MFDDDDIKIKRIPQEEQAPKYSIARIKKMKSFAQLRGMSKHNNREFDTPNADEQMTPSNIQLVGTDNIEQDVKQRIIEAGLDIKKLHKNAVLAVDHMFTASPDYFRPNGEPVGQWDQSRMEAWQKATMKFLHKEYGDNLVNAKLHLDESTPHIHAIMVPIHHDPNKRKATNLRAKEWFNGSKALSSFQDRYHEATKHLGLERGIKGSKAKHQRVKSYYQQLNQADKAISGVSPQDLTPRKTGVMQKETPEQMAKRINNKLQKDNQHLSDQAINGHNKAKRNHLLEVTITSAQKPKQAINKLLNGLSDTNKKEVLATMVKKAQELKRKEHSKQTAKEINK